MTIIELWTWAAVIPALVWAIGWLVIEQGMRGIKTLNASPHHPTQRVTLIVPAYNEEDLIERCVRSIMAQDMQAMDLVVVDDRSQDQTPAILQRLANEFPDRLRVVTSTEKSEDWNGKTYAMTRGLAATDAPWICFVDADHWFTAPYAVSRAMSLAEREELDFLTLYPAMEFPSLREKIMEPGCMMAIGAWILPSRANDPASKVAMGNAAFMLVRRETYDRLGGHTAICKRPDDDIALAQLIKHNGGRVMIVDGRDVESVRMYPNARDAWRGWVRIHAHALATWQMLLSIASCIFNTLFTWLSAAATLCLWATHDFAWNSMWRTPALAWCGLVAFAHVVLWRFYVSVPVRRGWLLAWPATIVICICILVAALLQKAGITANRWRGDSFTAPPTKQ